jgi:hypothetical protein
MDLVGLLLHEIVFVLCHKFHIRRSDKAQLDTKHGANTQRPPK